MIWCLYMSTILSAVAFITASHKSDKTGELMTISFSLSLVLAVVFLVIGLMTFEEPQRLKERAVEVGVGKFIATEKGEVKFFFVKPDGTLVESDTRSEGDNRHVRTHILRH